jgi:Zn-dependent peptidase ImmA (M78 family)
MILENIETRAERILAEHRIESVPVPIEKVLEKFNIQIAKAPSKDFSGILIRKSDGAMVGINSSEPKTRQRFSLGHELGHFLLHESEDTFVDHRNTNSAVHTSREQEADMFAAALLMPRNLLKKDIKEIPGGTFTEEKAKLLADKYGVSESAMKVRIFNLFRWLMK